VTDDRPETVTALLRRAERRTRLALRLALLGLVLSVGALGIRCVVWYQATKDAGQTEGKHGR
jgi:hypothetical protein